MKVLIDQKLCQGHGQCMLLAPEMFALDDDGIAFLLVDRPQSSLKQLIMRAVRACPVGAISVLED